MKVKVEIRSDHVVALVEAIHLDREAGLVQDKTLKVKVEIRSDHVVALVEAIHLDREAGLV